MLNPSSMGCPVTFRGAWVVGQEGFGSRQGVVDEVIIFEQLRQA